MYRCIFEWKVGIETLKNWIDRGHFRLLSICEQIYARWRSSSFSASSVLEYDLFKLRLTVFPLARSRLSFLISSMFCHSIFHSPAHYSIIDCRFIKSTQGFCVYNESLYSRWLSNWKNWSHLKLHTVLTQLPLPLVSESTEREGRKEGMKEREGKKERIKWNKRKKEVKKRSVWENENIVGRFVTARA